MDPPPNHVVAAAVSGRRGSIMETNINEPNTTYSADKVLLDRFNQPSHSCVSLPIHALSCVITRSQLSGIGFVSSFNDVVNKGCAIASACTAQTRRLGRRLWTRLPTT